MKWTDREITTDNKTYDSYICETDNKMFTGTIIKKTNTIWFVSIKYVATDQSYIVYEALINCESKDDAKVYIEDILENVNVALTRFFSNYGVRSKLENGHLIMACPLCFEKPSQKFIEKDNEYGLVCCKDGKMHCEAYGKTPALTVSRWNFYVGTIVSQIMDEERKNLKAAKTIKKTLKDKSNGK